MPRFFFPPFPLPRDKNKNPRPPVNLSAREMVAPTSGAAVSAP